MSYRTKWGAEWMQTVKNAAVRLLNTLDDKIIIKWDENNNNENEKNLHYLQWESLTFSV